MLPVSPSCGNTATPARKLTPTRSVHTHPQRSHPPRGKLPGVALTGGIGGAKNAALGALIVTALNDGLILLNVNPYAQEAVNGVVLVTAVALTIDRKKLGFIK